MLKRKPHISPLHDLIISFSWLKFVKFLAYGILHLVFALAHLENS
jgi:hypothetical protein